MPLARQEIGSQGNDRESTIGSIDNEILPLTVRSGDEHSTPGLMPEDKTGALAGTRLPSVEPVRRDDGGSPGSGELNKDL